MAEVWQEGGCLCGAVRFSLSAPPKWTALCHCDSCRRAASAPMVPWTGFRPEQVTWNGARKTYKSSRYAIRTFCETCGSQMSFQSERWPGEIHLYGVSLDDPEAFVPQLHCYTEERLSWVHQSDDLPKFAQSADAKGPERP